MSTTISNIYSDKTLTIGLDGGDIQLSSSVRLEDSLFGKGEFLTALKSEGLLDGQADTSSELPRVVKDSAGWVIIDGITMSTKDGADWNRRLGRNHLALAAHLDAEVLAAAEARQAAQAKAHALQCRRDDITNQLVNPDAWQRTDWKYSGNTQLVQRAVDQIIELEDKLANAS